MMDYELNRDELIQFILHHRKEISEDKLKRQKLVELVVIKTSIEIELKKSIT